WASRPGSRPTRRAARRRSTACCVPPGRTRSPPSSCTSAIPATPRATASASSATARSRSLRMVEHEQLRRTLLAIAQEAIGGGAEPLTPGEWAHHWLRRQTATVARAAPLTPGDWPDDCLRRQAATFVTLRMQGELRGCIGTIDARRPL